MKSVSYEGVEQLPSGFLLVNTGNFIRSVVSHTYGRKKKKKKKKEKILVTVVEKDYCR